MATHTWVDLPIPEASRLADLGGIRWDIHWARLFAEYGLKELVAEQRNWAVEEALSISSAVMYSRPFMSGVRAKLNDDDLKVFTPEQRAAHDYIRAYRDKHIAHSVNPFEENLPRGCYCVERVQDEGITSIGFGGGRITGLSRSEFEAIVDLTKVLETHVEALIEAEQAKLLPIVRSMPLEKVLSFGQKMFTASKRDVAKRRPE